jgi:hypothetical protein
MSVESREPAPTDENWHQVDVVVYLPDPDSPGAYRDEVIGWLDVDLGDPEWDRHPEAKCVESLKKYIADVHRRHRFTVPLGEVIAGGAWPGVGKVYADGSGIQRRAESWAEAV